ncbi:hypothetical protein ACM66B_005260 [Microbotryomycetes sp. NB124-2]
MTRPTSQLSQWLFTDRELSSAPSCVVPDRPQDRLTRSQDKWARARAVQRIWHIRDALQIPHLPVATAVMFMHRFYMRQTVQHYSPEIVATASLFLACKVEEFPKSLRHFVQACIEFSRDKVRARELYLKSMTGQVPTSDERNAEFKEVKTKVLKCEEKLLHTLCFDLEVEHAFPVIVRVTEAYWKHDQEMGSRVGKVAWQFVTDSFPCTLMLRHTPEVIAAAAIVGACVWLETELPLKPWSLLSEAERIGIERQRTEEGETFEPEQYWLEWLKVEPTDVANALELMLDNYAFAKVDFVREEAAVLKPQARDLALYLVSPTTLRPVLTHNSPPVEPPTQAPTSTDAQTNASMQVDEAPSNVNPQLQDSVKDAGSAPTTIRIKGGGDVTSGPTMSAEAASNHVENDQTQEDVTTVGSTTFAPVSDPPPPTGQGKLAISNLLG